MEILTKENVVGARIAPTDLHDFHSLTKGNQVSLVRIHFSHPGSDGKATDVGLGGRIGILKNEDKEFQQRSPWKIRQLKQKSQQNNRSAETAPFFRFD